MPMRCHKPIHSVTVNMLSSHSAASIIFLNAPTGLVLFPLQASSLSLWYLLMTGAVCEDGALAMIHAMSYLLKTESTTKMPSVSVAIWAMWSFALPMQKAP